MKLQKQAIYKIKMSKRYSGKSFKDSSVMKKSKLSFKEKRKLKKEKRKKLGANYKSMQNIRKYNPSTHIVWIDFVCQNCGS